MRNRIKYKGYIARVEYSDEDGCFVGHLAGIRDIIGFHGSTVDELRAAFRESVDDYLDACKRLGQKPNRPASGKIMLRIPPETEKLKAVHLGEVISGDFLVIIEPDGEGFIARSINLPVYGYGDDSMEALRALKIEIETLYDDLMEDDDFSSEWLNIKQFLQTRVEMGDCIVKSSSEA